MKHISKLATHSPKAIIEDALGLTAIFYQGINCLTFI